MINELRKTREHLALVDSENEKMRQKLATMGGTGDNTIYSTNNNGIY